MFAVIAASLVILFLPSFVATSAAQSINAVAAAMMRPAVAAIHGKIQRAQRRQQERSIDLRRELVLTLRPTPMALGSALDNSASATGL
jgi:hypothetical protein